jgi:addiction module RelE/StbE family toxin
MIIRWSPEAAADFDSIVAYLLKQSPSTADRIARTIYNSVESLDTLPNRGRPGRVQNTRELVLTPLPYLVVYRVRIDTVEISRVLHGSQRWP